MNRSLEKITILALILITIVLGIVSISTPFKVSGTELDIENNRISVYFNKPISRDLDLTEYITSEPVNDMRFLNLGNRVEITLGNLDLGNRYSITIKKTLTNIFNESLTADSVIKFISDSPRFTYLKTNIVDSPENDQNTKSYSINLHDLKLQTDDAIYTTENEITSYSVQENLLLIAESEEKILTKLSLIDIATKKVLNELRLSNKNLFKVELAENEEFFIFLSQEAKLEKDFVIPLGASTLTKVNIRDFTQENFNYKTFTDDILDSYITPDSEGLLLRGYDSTFYIKSLAGEDEPINLAKFIGTGGFNTKGSQIIFSAFDPTLAFASFPYISIYNSDRSTEEIKVADSYILDPVFGNSSAIYYSKRLKEFIGSPGFFGIFKYENGTESEVIIDENITRSFELPKLSSDDNYLCYEVYEESAMVDYTNQRNFINQRKPKSAGINVYEFEREGNVVEIPNAYDCKWI